MILVLLESPYAGYVERNLAYARACARDCLLRGEAPFASHLLYAANLIGPEQPVTVPLTRGFSTVVDEADAERVLERKWFAQGKEPHVYAARHQRVGDAQLTIYLHRFLLDAEPGEEVDHINGDRLDNRRANLRIATHQENSRNTGRRSDNLSGYKGVSAQGDRWRANIRIGDEQVYLGAFDTAEAAARAYDSEAVKRYGRFARVNFTPAGILDDDLPAERELGIRAGFAWGQKAERTVVYMDHGMSRGMEAGIQVAKLEGRPVEHRRLYPAPFPPHEVR